MKSSSTTWRLYHILDTSAFPELGKNSDSGLVGRLRYGGFLLFLLFPLFS